MAPNRPRAASVAANGAGPDASAVAIAAAPLPRLEACANGLGVALLPCAQGDAMPGLERVGQPIAGLTEGVFLLAHPDTLARRDVRTVFNAIVEAFKELGGR